MFLVVISRLWARKETLFEDPWVATLIEGDNSQLLVSILLDYAKGIIVGVKRRHENHWHVDTILCIEVLRKD